MGFAALLLGLAVPLGAACTCGPTEPSGPPPQETCDAAGMTYTGVTSVTVTSVRPVYGAQGGMHTEIQFSATGTTLPTCAEYTLYIGDSPSSNGTIRGTVTGTSFASRAIIYLGVGVGGPSPGSVSVEAFGVRSAPFGSADAGTGDAPAELDAGSDAPDEADAGEADAPL